ncbi:translocation and assembly module TamB [Rhodobacteraceae bacterium MBR-64]
MRVLAFLLCLLPGIALGQGDDRGFLVGLLEDNLSSPGRQVTINGFAGALSSQATIDEILIGDRDGTWLTLRGATLDWNRAALLRGRVEVNELSAREIIIARPPIPPEGIDPPPAAAPGFSLPDLPVSIRVDALRVDRVELGAPVLGQAAVMRLRASATLADGAGTATLNLTRTDGRRAQIAFDGGYDNATGQLRVDLSVVEGAGGLIAGITGLPGAPPLELSVAGTGPLSAYGADLRLATAGRERLTGRIDLGTTEGDGGQTFRAALGGDIAALVAPDYRAFFGPDIALDVAGVSQPDGRVDISALDLRTAALSLSGRIGIAAGGLPDLLDVTGTIAAQDGGAVLLPLSGDPTRLGRADFNLSLGNGADPDALHLTTRITGLDRTDIAIAALTLTGNGTLTRGPDALDMALDFAATGLAPTDPALATALGPRIAGTATVQWTTGTPVQVPALRLAGGGYAIHLSDLSFAGVEQAGRISGAARGRLDDLSQFSALAGRSLGGAADLVVNGSYAPLSGAGDIDLALTGQDLGVGIAEVDSLLTGQSRVALSVLRDQTGTTLRNLAINARTLDLRASGSLTPGAGDVTADLKFTDLAALGPAYGGALDASVRVIGTADGLRTITATARGDALKTGIPEVDGLLAGPSTIDVKATQRGEVISVETLAINATTLALTATGTVDPGRSDLTADLEFSDLSVMGGRYRGGLSAQARLTEAGATRHLGLNATGTALAIGQPQADAILRGTSTLALDLTEEAGRITVTRADLTNPQLTAQATADLNGADRQATFSARLADLGLLAPGLTGPLTAEGRVNGDAAGYDVDIKASGPGGIEATVNGTVAADFSTADLGIAGTLQTALANPFIAPRLIDGAARFDLRLNGAPGLGALSGRVTVPGARLVDPGSRINLQNLNVVVDLGGGRADLAVQTDVETGGRILLSGPVSLAAPYNGDLKLVLDKVVLVDPELYRTELRGDAAITGPLTGGGLISGTIRLGETEIRVPSTGFGSAGAVAGLQHINEPTPVQQTRARAGLIETPGADTKTAPARPFRLDVRIRAPQRIFIRGRGLDAEMGGDLRVTGTTSDIIPVGGFDLIRGRLNILGQRFTLDDGSALLQGELIPYIRLTTSTTTPDVTATINVEGPADDPKITFSSTPELPEEEVLAQILFGRNLSTISAFQALQLANAVGTLSGSQGEGVVSRLRQGFALDDFDVTTDAEGNTGVRAGKYISRRIYTDVAVDATGRSELNLNIDVTKSLKARGSVANDGSTGLGMFFERDY